MAVARLGRGADSPPLVMLHNTRSKKAPVQLDTSSIENIEDLAFSPDGRALAAACLLGKVRVWDCKTHEHATVRGQQTAMTKVVWLDEDQFAAGGVDPAAGPALSVFAG